MLRTVPAILFLVVLLASCNPSDKPGGRKVPFSEGWYFVRLEDDAIKDTGVLPVVQRGRDWESQFFIERVTTDGEKTVPEIPDSGRVFLRRVVWQRVDLPHTAYVEPLVVKHPWQGICYYRKSFFIPAADSVRNLFLHFEGAMQEAVVWVNGRRAAVHAGGYTPFEVRLGPYLHYGDTNEVMVHLDNRDNPLIPPGKPQDRLDFCYYSGLYRDVWLIRTGRLYIPDAVAFGRPAAGGVFITFPEVSRRQARLRVRTTVLNEGYRPRRFVLEQRLLDAQGRTVARAVRRCALAAGDTLIAGQTLTVARPHLWDLDDPYLYTLETRLLDGGTAADRLTSRIGIRRFAFSRDSGFLLNGRPVRLVGTNRHQEYPWTGNALSRNAQYRDMVKIKEGGFNIVRLGHYPQDPAVLDACDELGLLVIEPIPGWQYFNGNPLFVQRTFRDIRDMIRRDRNHPSVVLWETVLNESYLPARWKEEAYAIAHEEYPSDQCYTSGDMYGSYVWDVLYNDWHEDFTRPNDSRKPGFIREYGDYEFGGNNSTTRQRRGAGEQKLLLSAWNFQWSHNRYNAYYPWTTGNAIWEMFDHNRGCCPTISASGASDIFRIPKFTWYFFRSQLDTGRLLVQRRMPPSVFLATSWCAGEPLRKVVVYGNVEEVELQINGRTVARNKPDDGPDTPYFFPEKGEHPWDGGHPFDGGNCRHLAHPPFTFDSIRWEQGVITAVGYLGGKAVARHRVRTPEKPARLGIGVDLSGKVPVQGEKDLLFVYVRILDQYGTLCVEDNHTVVHLRAVGAGLLSPATRTAEAGIATFLITTGRTPQVEMQATAEGLAGAEKVLVLARDGK